MCVVDDGAGCQVVVDLRILVHNYVVSCCPVVVEMMDLVFSVCGEHNGPGSQCLVQIVVLIVQ